MKLSQQTKKNIYSLQGDKIYTSENVKKRERKINDNPPLPIAGSRCIYSRYSTSHFFSSKKKEKKKIKHCSHTNFEQSISTIQRIQKKTGKTIFLLLLYSAIAHLLFMNKTTEEEREPNDNRNVYGI